MDIPPPLKNQLTCQRLGESIHLRPIATQDFDIVVAWWGIPEIRQFSGALRVPDYFEVRDCMTRAGRRDFMIVFEGRRVGRTCLIHHEGFHELSVYVCELALQGRGIGKRAIALTLDEMVSGGEVRSWIHSDNLPSQKAFEANQFRRLTEDESGAYWYGRTLDETTNIAGGALFSTFP